MTHIVSIQSHVAYGYVGNRAAVFPLQRLGLEVTAINTVQFSNHTGYGAFTGQVFSPEHLRDVLDGVEALTGLTDMQAVLSGYMGDEGIGRAVLDSVHRVRLANPDALYCCDPVMGDIGRGFFVREGIPEWMRAHAVPSADIVTPNQFELGWLTGREIVTLADALEAAAQLRALGPRVVLVTSLDVHDDDRSATDAARIEMLVDTAAGSWRVATPRVEFDIPPNGAGDFTAAMFLAHCLREGLEGDGPAQALAASAGAVQALFEHTRRAGTRELALISAQHDIVAPPIRVSAERLR
ncbi:pyridoxal kinase PdxY [Kushneria phosphatilytica]|uniref:pyridoxal kinase n=1 Tax=Kushneria phosphatilytica TaxID=657387 RepID=A0A1S1NTC3_9GAMM|nr:pyridoxal kinase PdxY [Kushneria phosphatilytica]OHV08873.1 pyridoxal kinase [Kushneria phosphatilytica]QEL12594.1 pyridoxal kinase PdxY [Kushneria phosphatilytica]